MKRSGMKIRCLCSSGQSTVECGDETTFGDFQEIIQKHTNIIPSRQRLRFRMPSKLIECSDTSTKIKTLGIQSGECICVDELDVPEPVQTTTPTPAPTQSSSSNNSAGGTTSNNKKVQPLSTIPECIAPDMFVEGCMMRCVVPADNSCLFNSLALVCEGDRSRSGAQHIRQAVADYILAHGDIYTKPVLDDKEPKEYCEWITSKQHWGGAIELAVLSHVFQTEIAAVDIKTTRVDVYGQDQEEEYHRRVYLLYDGIHYDGIGFRFCEGIDEDGYLTLFSPADPLPMQKSQQMAAELKKAHAFTDVGSFTLKCLICGKGLAGETEAVKHGRETGHTNFSEYA
eukprot:TRINITY_DN57358_c0_g1_i1.p1 TRINITY_DN57358_c0_g1~~TRINITY_DN57358_c0_g1_i1.p1  ORF type:complete len:341 (+),score=29.70 TRINITY_DN57358_c0_g1_i1:29-1051(+)